MPPPQAQSVWNSLEIAKLLVSGLTPMVVLAVGFWVQRLLKAIESAQWKSRTVIEWRIKVYEEFSPILNEIYCYLVYVGDWKATTPPEILNRKRVLDQRFNIVRPLFSEQFTTIYNNFIDLCFRTYRGKGIDAGLRTGFQSRKEALGESWDETWENLFVESADKTPREDIVKAYELLTDLLARELGLEFVATPGPPQPESDPGKSM